MSLLRSDDRHTLADGPLEDVAVQRRANADLDHMMRVDQAFFDRVIERRAVTPGETKAFGPGVDMPVEMEQPQWAIAAR